MTQATMRKSASPTTELSRWTPFNGFGLGRPFDRIFEDVWARRPAIEESGLIAPAIDVAEDDESVVISAELPGLKKDDVKIQIEGGVLSISGEKSQETEKKGRSFHRLERRYGSFYRAVSLPSGANPDKAEAEFSDGVLKIRMPLREDAKPKLLKIK
jgi:HSP20 family protein